MSLYGLRECAPQRRPHLQLHEVLGVKYFTFMLHADNGFELNLPVFLIHDK